MCDLVRRGAVWAPWIWVLWTCTGCKLFESKQDDQKSTTIIDDCEVAGDDSDGDGNANSRCECIAAEARCSDRATLQVCDSEGFWRQTACEFVCVEDADGAACGGECQPEARGCTNTGQSAVICGADGQWGVEAECPAGQRCDPGVGQCLPLEGERCDATGACFGDQVCIAGFEDADGDTWGDEGKPTGRCGLIDGFSARGGDCCDDDDQAHPGSAEAPNRATRCGGSDFDCDGQAEVPMCSKPIHPVVHQVFHGEVGNPTCEGDPEGGVVLTYDTEGCSNKNDHRGCAVTSAADFRPFLKGEQLLEANVCVTGPLEGAVNLWLESEDRELRHKLGVILQEQLHRAGCHRVLFAADDVGGLETCDERQPGYPHLCIADEPATDGEGGEGGSGEAKPASPRFPTSDEATLAPFSRAHLTLMTEWCFEDWHIPTGQRVEIRLSELRLHDQDCGCQSDTECVAGGYCDMNAMPPVACCDCSHSCQGVCRWDR